MEIKAENSRRIIELEQEFSDKKIAEFFRVEGDEAKKPAGQLLYKRRTKRQEIIIVTALAVCIVVLFLYLLTIV